MDFNIIKPKKGKTYSKTPKKIKAGVITKKKNKWYLTVKNEYLLEPQTLEDVLGFVDNPDFSITVYPSDENNYYKQKNEAHFIKIEQIENRTKEQIKVINKFWSLYYSGMTTNNFMLDNKKMIATYKIWEK